MELQPEELLLPALLRRAIRDAQGKQERVGEEASRWLWTVAPAIAERAKVSLSAGLVLITTTENQGVEL